MKKLLLILPVMALAACNQEQVQPNEFVANCESVLTSKHGGVLYKCPVTEELTAIQAMEANCMLRRISGNELDVDAIVADKDHVYVAFDGQKCGENQVAYRVMVKNPTIDGKAMHAVGVCK